MKQRVIDLTNVSQEDWLRLRQEGLGGSDVAVCMGLNPFQTKYELYLSKTTAPMPVENEKMYWGTKLETAILETFAERTNFMVKHVKEMRYHSQIPYIFGNVDGLIWDENNQPYSLVEIKNIGDSSFQYWRDGIPDYYFAQIQNYLAVYDFQFGYMAVLVGGQRLEIFRVERNDEFIEKMYEKCANFWNEYILAGKEPPLEVVDLEKKEIEEEKAIEANRDALFVYGKLGGIKDQIKILEKEKEEAEDELKLIIGENTALTFNGSILVTWKGQYTNRINTKVLRERYPEIAKELVETNYSRKFIVKTIKETNNEN